MPGSALTRRRVSPKSLQDKFGGRRFLPVDPPDFLDCDVAELELIGASENPEKELGIEFKPDRENEDRADIFKILKLPRELVRELLFEGQMEVMTPGARPRSDGGVDAKHRVRSRHLANPAASWPGLLSRP
jgi:hypothetical protein